MNRRSFLKLLTTTAAAAVAGLRPRPEPIENISDGIKWGIAYKPYGETLHDLLSATHKDFLAEDCLFISADNIRWWHGEH